MSFGGMLGRVSKKEDLIAVFQFLFQIKHQISLIEKAAILKRLYKISYFIDCPHTQKEILTFIDAILNIPDLLPGCVVEAGCYKGGSTAKFSLAASLMNRPLVVFDSFEGLPSHSEPHNKNIYGNPVTFSEGEYKGTLEEVEGNVTRFGQINACQFIKGWFADNLPSFKEPVAAVYLDVDLVSSTKVCIQYLYPLLAKGGFMFSQDGHLPLVIDILDDYIFWEKEVGVSKPVIEGLGTSKLIKIHK
jgi:O-methyltransferase